VGDAAAHVVNGVASLANAAGHHPDAAAQLLAGLLLTEIGATGQVAGVALDLTGVGAVAGVPTHVASAAAIARYSAALSTSSCQFSRYRGISSRSLMSCLLLISRHPHG